MAAKFKICNVCTSRYQRPLRKTIRKCPTCGGNQFRAPTCEEISAREKQNAQMQELLDSLDLDD